MTRFYGHNHRRSRAQLNAISRSYSKRKYDKAVEEFNKAIKDGIEVHWSRYPEVTLRRIREARQAAISLSTTKRHAKR